MATDVRFVLHAVDRTAGAFQSVRSAVEGMTDRVGALQASLAGVAASMGVLGLAGMVKDVVEASASFQDLAAKTGASVESLSALAGVAKMSDTSTEAVVKAMNRLSKSMHSASEGGNGAAAALKALRVDFDSFRGLSPDEKMLSLAKAMDKFRDSGGKSAVAMELLGEEGVALMPFMKDLAELGELQAKVTAEQAAKADAFDDNLKKVVASSGAWRKELATGMIPALDEGAQAFLDVINGTGGLREEVKKLAADGSIAEWTRGGITALTYLLDAGIYVQRMFVSVGKGIAGLAVAAVELSGGNFRGAAAAVAALSDDLETAWSADTLGQRIRARMDDLRGFNRAAQSAQETLNAPSPSTKPGAGAAKADPFAAILKGISERTAAYSLELQQQGKLTEGQQAAVKILDDLRTGTLQLTQAKAQQLGVALDEMLVSEKRRDLHVEERKARDALREQDRKDTEAREKAVAALGGENDKLREEIELIGLSGDQQLRVLQQRNETIILTKEAELAELQLQSAVSGTMSRREIALGEEIRLLRERNGLMGDKSWRDRSSQAAGEHAQAWTRANEQIASSFVDNLMAGGKSVKQYLIDLFRTTVLRPMLAPIGQAAAGVMGMLTGAPAAAQQVGGGGSMLSTIGSIGSLAGSLGAFGGGISAGIGGLAGSLGLSATGATLGGAMEAASIAMGAGNIAGGLGTMLGALGPIAMGVGLLVSLASKGGETRHGGQFTGTDLIAAPSGGLDLQAAQQAISGTMQSTNALLASLGSSSKLDVFQTGFEDSKKGKGFAYARGTLSSGAQFGDWDREGWMQRAGSMTSEESVKAFAEELVQSSLLAIQADLDHLPAWVGQYLDGVDIDALSQEAGSAILQQINGVLTQRAELEERLYLLTSTAAEQLTRTRAAEVAAVHESNRALIDQIHAQEDLQRASEEAARASERLAALQGKLSGVVADFLTAGELRQFRAGEIQKRLAQAGMSFGLDVILGATRADLRALYEQMAALGNLDAQEAILDVASAFTSLTDPAADAVSAIDDVASALQDAGRGIYEWLRNLQATRAGTASPEALLQQTRANYLQDLQLGRAGDLDALGRINGSAEAYIEAQKGYTASGGATQAVISQIIAEMSALPAVQSYEQQTLTVLQTIAQTLADLPDNLADRIAGEFGALDLDGSGGLTFAELQSALSVTDAQLHAIFATLDADGDGTISRLEALRDRADTGNSTANAILGRLSQDSILSYGKADVASVYNAIAANTGNTAAYAAWSYSLLAGLSASTQGINYMLGVGSAKVMFRGSEGRNAEWFYSGGAFTNGIATRPTMIPMAGLGERGQSEAIMPLRNIGGQLGVAAATDPEVAARLRSLEQLAERQARLIERQIEVIAAGARGTIEETARVAENTRVLGNAALLAAARG